MAFTPDPFDVVHDDLLAAASGRFPDANLSEGSHLNKRAAISALAITDANHNLLTVQNDLMADTAKGVMLARHMAVRGVPVRGAVGSAQDLGLRVFGTIGATVPSAEQLVHVSSGLLFATSSGGTIAATGYLDVNVASQSTGALTNLEAGQELQFSSTPVGLEDNAKIVINLTGGLDVELEDSQRTRLLNRIAEPAGGGNRNDWEQWTIEALASIASAYVYPNRNGLGSVDVAALKAGSGSARVLSGSERAAVLTYLDGVRPVTATARVLETVAVPTDVEVKITPIDSSEYVFDFDDSTPPVVASYAAGTREVTLTADRPGNMGAGDRVVFDTVSALNTGRQWTIESIDSGVATKFTLSEDLPFTPIATDIVYSGSPETAAIWSAIVALFDALGSANPDTNSYGGWSGNLRLSRLFERVQTQAGVLDSEIVAPVANVEADDPAYPSNGTIELLTPGLILVRRA